MDVPAFDTYEIGLQGGPLDGRTIPHITGDPTTPPDSVHHSLPDGRVAVYTPRPSTADDGPLWNYVFIGYRFD
ncbi:hypothetical protein ELQ39_28190 [Streptomyces sp. GB4-14]|uniref:hypothetical protein n=1 Tax=Streptomyces sp. GB4-14 TaxID=2498703 RepID=UPI001F5F37E9|nr:hypothetical protein [Streptomyces sp. GB4-14]